MVRQNWQNLNGQWEFAFDFGDSGKERGMWEPDSGGFDKKITVPFCPESELSGIGYKDFMAAVWYRKSIKLTAEQCAGRVLLHFGAVDYRCEVWVNGQKAGWHKGGYSSFTVEITDFVKAGDNIITVCAADDTRSGKQPRGKQCGAYYSRGCDYTRTTGIWQTVWLEFVPETYIKSYKVIPDPANSKISISVKLSDYMHGASVRAEAYFDGKACGAEEYRVTRGDHICFDLALDITELWDIGKPNLYDLKLELRQYGHHVDLIDGYFGLRTIGWHDKAFWLNGRPVFMRLVLDQGFYPDGIYTAPSDAALERDIDMCLELGFNGARLHQKVFEERFLYHADKKGYMVWGEHANWGLDISTAEGLENFLPEWTEIVSRDFNHPALIGWCPFNETNNRQDNEVLRTVYNVTKLMDPTRPVIDTSGYVHVVTDIFDIHFYEQDPEVFKSKFKEMKNGGEVFDPRAADHEKLGKYCGQPYFVSEYGGTWWNKDAGKEYGAKNWGYGERPDNEAEVLRRYVGLTSEIMENPYICGFCYTQPYDVEQEQNGLYMYSRERKFSDETYAAIKKCNEAVAAIEKRKK